MYHILRSLFTADAHSQDDYCPHFTLRELGHREEEGQLRIPLLGSVEPNWLWILAPPQVLIFLSEFPSPQQS